MPLVDTGLVCRYYFDEAASGQSPTSVADASSNNLPLNEIDYGGTNLNWVELASGQRGLDSASTTGTQRARRAIANSGDALRTALDGAQKVTIELVVRVDAGNTSNGRIFAINDRVGGNPQLGVSAQSTGSTVRIYFNGSDRTGDITSLATRSVYHVVIDSTLATSTDRIKVAVNGGTLTAVASLTQNEALSLPNDLDLTAFNRESSGTFDRSFDGALFYAAIYAYAFTQSDVDNNAGILSSNDDTPAGGASVEQEGFRFGADDGSESSHSWLGAADENITAPADQNVLINFVVNVTGSPGAQTYKLQYRKVGDPDWSDMPVA